MMLRYNLQGTPYTLALREALGRCNHRVRMRHDRARSPARPPHDVHVVQVLHADTSQCRTRPCTTSCASPRPVLRCRRVVPASSQIVNVCVPPPHVVAVSKWSIVVMQLMGHACMLHARDVVRPGTGARRSLVRSQLHVCVYASLIHTTQNKHPRCPNPSFDNLLGKGLSVAMPGHVLQAVTPPR